MSLRDNPIRHDIFGCGLGCILTRGSPNYNKPSGPIKVRIGSNDEGPICANWNTKAARAVLLDNLYTEPSDCHSVTAPLQKHANCWFNTMFMVFFASDKGRKFFRFFRAQMIKGVRFQRAAQKGEKPKEVKITPPSLAKAFFLLNAAIEASMDTGANVAHLMDTNNLIASIYTAINRGRSHKAQNVMNVKQAGNPLTYYIALVEYLGGTLNQHQIRIRRINLAMIGGVIPSKMYASTLPDIAVFEMSDDSGPSMTKPIPRIISIKGRDGEEHRYGLDAAMVRDTEKQHYCALISCGGKGYGFDGGSFSRLTKVKWHEFTHNPSRSWTFEGSKFSSGKQIRWSFSSAYAYLFYYRLD